MTTLKMIVVVVLLLIDVTGTAFAVVVEFMAIAVAKSMVVNNAVPPLAPVLVG